MRRFLEAKLTGTLVLLMLACFLSYAHGYQFTNHSDQAALAGVGHGPTMPPDPDEPPAVLGHGPTMPPDPDEPPAVLGHGPTMPPDPDEPPSRA